MTHDPEAAVIEVEGCGGRFPARVANLQVANSGTSLRFLTAMLATARGPIIWTALRGCASARSRTCSWP